MKDFGRQACGTCHTPFRLPPAVALVDAPRGGPARDPGAGSGLASATPPQTTPALSRRATVPEGKA